MTTTKVPSVAVPIDYPDGPMADAFEAYAQKSLPELHGLEQAELASERMEIYEQVICQQREEFVELYGDPFGWEKRENSREEISQITVNFADYVISAR